MLKVLIPVNGSANCLFAVKQVIREFMNNTAMEIHLLNVQSPLPKYVTRFVNTRTIHDYHRDEANKALQPAKQMLDGFGIPYATHTEIGERAKAIIDTANRLHCSEIVMGTARKNSLTRWVENSLTNKVLEATSVPVEVITGGDVSPWERFGIPASIGALLALLLAVAD